MGGDVDIKVPDNATLRLMAEHASLLQCVREIAAMNRKAGSETAKNWLYQHGYALEEGGYIPGKGFEKDMRV